MRRIENDCNGCDIYCCDCGLRHVEHSYCDRCGSEETLYCFGDEELCLDCIEKAVSKEKEDGICEECGEECTVYADYGLCEDCFFDSLEVAEGSDE